MSKLYELHYHIRIMGDEYRRITVLKIDSPKGSLLHKIISEFAGASRFCHHSYSLIRTLINAILLIDGKLKSLLNRKPIEIATDELQTAVIGYEKSLINRNSISLSSKHKYSNIMRRLISGTTVISDNQTTKTAIESLRKTLPKESRGRTKSILPDVTIDSIQHQNPLDLIEKARTLTEDLKTLLINACERELESYQEVLKHQNHMIEQQQNANTMGLHFSPEHQFTTGLLDAVATASNEELSAFLGDKRLIKISLNLNQPLISRYAIASRNNLPWFFARQRLPNSVIFSIYLSILVKSGWNSGSLNSMPHTSIHSDKAGGWILQGFKVKTDDDTPTYEADYKDTALTEGIRLLLWNRTQLIKLGVISEGNLNLWNGWKYDYSEMTTINIEAAKNRFIRDHGLTPFRLKDLRNLSAANLFLTTQNLEDVKLLLGHVDLAQTAEYLDITLMDSIDKALILEFSKRLEAAAVFQSLGHEEFEKRHLDPKHLDTRLIFTTGIGTQCSNPTRYPHSKGISPCDGEHCLCNDGCTNHQLVITLDGVIISMRTLIWYKYRWEQIYNRNNNRFISIDLPRILFITALINHVKKIRPDLFYQARDTLRAEDQKLSIP